MLANVPIETAIAEAIVGSKAATDEMIIVNAPANAVAPATPLTASVAKPVDSKARPAPIAAAATPNKVNAPATVINAGPRGASAVPAAPRPINTTANAPKPVASTAIGRAPRAAIGTISKFIAVAIKIIPTEAETRPPEFPLKIFKDAVIAPIDTPTATSPFASCDNSILPSNSIGTINKFKAADIPINEEATPFMFSPFMDLRATVSKVIRPVTLEKP